MELLILKAGEKYIRFLENGDVECTDMNKASVFPLSEENNVLNRLKELRATIEDVSVKKLKIIETDL